MLFVEFGQISPPIGINLFLLRSIWDGKLSDVILGTISFHLTMFLMLFSVILWPELALGCRIICREDPMQRSTSRILTTHTGSLPRPRELTRLYALRAAGGPAGEAEIARAGRDAVRRVVSKQHEVGMDVDHSSDEDLIVDERERMSSNGTSQSCGDSELPQHTCSRTRSRGIS
jgi:hypothetical protein